jgi:hypothetical protein
MHNWREGRTVLRRRANCLPSCSESRAPGITAMNSLGRPAYPPAPFIPNSCGSAIKDCWNLTGGNQNARASHPPCIQTDLGGTGVCTHDSRAEEASRRSKHGCGSDNMTKRLSLPRRMALALMEHAARVLPSARRPWAKAMQHKLSQVENDLESIDVGRWRPACQLR